MGKIDMFIKPAQLLVILLISACSSQIFAPEGTTTTVVMIRHAERTAVTKELTEAGHQRAAALPAAVADLDIAAIYSPDKSRNINTVKPLAEKLGISITVVDVKKNLKNVAQQLVTRHPGRAVVWVGNFDNLNSIYPVLGGVGDPPLEYGDLYILKVPDQGKTEVIKKRFGQ